MCRPEFRSLRRKLLADLRSGDFDREWEAYKEIDSGAAGNWLVFLLYRFWRLEENDVILEPFWMRVLRPFSQLLWEWRMLLYGCELVTVIVLLIVSL